MKNQHDQHRRADSFKVGNIVYLHLHSYHLQSLAHHPNNKLVPHFFGPFYILAQISIITYKLDLPSTAQIHPIFHISQLQAAKGSIALSQLLPPALQEDFTWDVQLAIIRAFWDTPHGCNLLIQWKDLPNFECSCESLK